MKMLSIRSVGLSLPLGSSAAAAAVAINELLGNPLPPSDLVLAGLESESKVSGYHADNIAPSILGDFVLIRSYDPLDVMQLKFPPENDLFFILVNPEFEAPKKKRRGRRFHRRLQCPNRVWNCSQAGALVASVLQGDLIGFGKVLSSDKIVEPRRAPLIPGIEAAIKAGAFGCAIELKLGLSAVFRDE
ncbi:hypothetical protein ABFX02_03G067100 [Erythranthe guttata]